MKLFRSIDSEYLSAGKKDEPHNINIGVYDGRRAHSFRDRDGFLSWLNKVRPRLMFAWVSRAEFGSLEAWNVLGYDIPEKSFQQWKESGRIQRFTIQRDRGITTVLDIQPFFKSLKRGSLEKAAELLAEHYNDPTLAKVKPPPTSFGADFGKRMPETESEWLWFDDRVKSDARLTAKAAEFLYNVLLPKFIANPKPKRYYSWGTVARVYFQFPQMNVRMGRTVYVKALHLKIRDEATFAGRSDALSIGAIPAAYYLDVTSLYPLSAVATDAYRIIDVEPMSRTELNVITNPSDYVPYCWLAGTFESDNDIWGLPERSAERNFYLTGRLSGRLRHSLDLQAAKAKIINLDYGLKPVFGEDRNLHDQYAKLTLNRIEDEITDPVERMGAKEILNSSTGAVGATNPQPTTTSNFPAYSTIVAEGHYLMSQIFDILPKPIHYLDTDSAWCETKREGHLLDIDDLAGEWTLPLLLDVKGYGEHPKIFRSKHYNLDAANYGFHGVTIEFEDWLRIVSSMPQEARNVHRQVRGTFRTRSGKGKELEVGRWYHEVTDYTLEDLTRMFRADVKRLRSSYDAYSLVCDGKWVGSRSLTIPEFDQLTLEEDDETLVMETHMGRRLPVEFVKEWIRKIAKTEQSLIWTRGT